MEQEVNKKCAKCGEIKSIHQFFKLEKVKYRSRCKTCMLQANKVWDEKNLERKMWNAAKARAAKKNIPFDISVSDIVIPTVCPILGIEMHRSSNGRGVGNNLTSPSLDRIIPHLGYVKGNVRVISFRANTLKNNASIEELEKILDDARRITSVNC